MGRIIVLWKKNSIRLNKLTKSTQFIQLEASPLSSLSRFHISMVYGANDTGSRRQLWEDLLNSQPSIPWILVGDFNCIRNNSEKGGSLSRNAPAMSDFNAFIDDATLMEMPTTGATFTWSNMHHSNHICRLARTLCSQNCQAFFPNCSAHVAPQLISDHCLILITLSWDRGRTNCLFKIYNHWTQHPNFLTMVARLWRYQYPGNPMYHFSRKLANLKAHLVPWAKETFGNVASRISQCTSSLSAI